MLPTYAFSDEDKQLLWQNKQYFAGHPGWIVQLLLSVADDPGLVADAKGLLDQRREHSCDEVLCSSCPDPGGNGYLGPVILGLCGDWYLVSK